jgi:Protein of unknown function (DUF3300)
MSIVQAGRAGLLWSLVLLLAAPPDLMAQGTPPAQPPPAEAPAGPTFPPEELDQIVAPIALYPDDLLAQVLMASTYPLDVVQAARWVKANPNVKGDQLEAAMQQQSWDPSVKSLTTVPQVLDMMNEKLDWTQKLGDAFLAQEKDVMTAVQRLRGKAYAAGNLKTTPEQKVVVEQAPAQTTVVQQAPPQIIEIQSPNPQVVYVPTYNPTVVYGAWPYPAYPPYSYYPPGYVAGASLLSFGVGMAVGAAIWGNCNWGGGNVNMNVNRYNSFNRSNVQNNNWQHNAANRKGVPYRDQGTAQKFGQGTRSGADSREGFRGRAEGGRQQPGQGGFDRGSAGGPGGREGLQGRPGGGTGDRPGAGARPDTGGPGGRQGLGGGGQPSVGTRDVSSRGGGLGGDRGASAYQGVGQGSQTRDFSNRGQSSRQSMGQSGGASAAPRGGGGFGGGGGGGGRGGGGGGRRR